MTNAERYDLTDAEQQLCLEWAKEAGVVIGDPEWAFAKTQDDLFDLGDLSIPIGPWDDQEGAIWRNCLRMAAEGDVAAVIAMRQAYGLPIFV